MGLYETVWVRLGFFKFEIPFEITWASLGLYETNGLIGNTILYWPFRTAITPYGTIENGIKMLSYGMLNGTI